MILWFLYIAGDELRGGHTDACVASTEQPGGHEVRQVGIQMGNVLKSQTEKEFRAPTQG